jgi:hypothetical protein
MAASVQAKAPRGGELPTHTLRTRRGGRDARVPRAGGRSAVHTHRASSRWAALPMKLHGP